MKINHLDAHDRFTYLNKTQSDLIAQGIEECKTKNQLGKALLSLSPYIYIFAHKRQIGMDERFSLVIKGFYAYLEETPTHRLIWQPRLTKPAPQENSMLFKVYKNKDWVKVYWIIPEASMWPQYEKGKLSESEIIVNSIHSFKTDSKKLMAPEEEDLSQEQCESIYKIITKDKSLKLD
jgi:hypothetical protein